MCRQSLDAFYRDASAAVASAKAVAPNTTPKPKLRRTVSSPSLGQADGSLDVAGLGANDNVRQRTPRRVRQKGLHPEFDAAVAAGDTAMPVAPAVTVHVDISSPVPRPAEDAEI